MARNNQAPEIDRIRRAVFGPDGPPSLDPVLEYLVLGDQREFPVYGMMAGVCASRICYLLYNPTRELLNGADLGVAPVQPGYRVDREQGYAAILIRYDEEPQELYDRIVTAARELTRRTA